MRFRVRALAALLAIALAACARSAPAPQPTPTPVRTIFDRSLTACTVTYDGIVSYRVPAGAFPPIDVRTSTCGATALQRDEHPPRPRWALPPPSTQTRFVLTSLQQAISFPGMRGIERIAAAHRVPVTWMVGHPRYLDDAADFNAFHAANGDDAQSEFYSSLHALIAKKLPWFVPKVSILTAGAERDIPRALSFDEHAFWGITWNSLGTDLTYDYGAPWGTYCADVTSYKRPQPDGGCAMLAFEWTARDLTRAYFSGQEAAFSTDPDDLLLRGGFSIETARAYVRRIVDAYAAAGETQPIVMTVQIETFKGTSTPYMQVLDALLDQVVRDRMKLETLSSAADDARSFSAAPRAVAFPYLAGGKAMPSSLLDGDTLYPATIDYHDARIGMTFVSGHTLPSRIFRYADYPASRFDRPLPAMPPSQMPVLQSARVSNGWLALSLDAPRSARFGIAIWSDPARAHFSGPGAIEAGHAATVLVFDVKKGANAVRYRCTGCRSTTFDYSR